MEEKIDSWCIRVTYQNRKFLKDFFGDTYVFNEGSYYGVNKETGNYGGYNVFKFSYYFDYVITTKEFLEKINNIKNNELNYEVWFLP